MTDPRPDLDPGEALDLVRDRWELEVDAAAELEAERDRNFRVDAADGDRYVLKVAPAGEDRDGLELQHRILAHVSGSAAGLPVPRVVPSSDGREIVELDRNGTTHLVRLLDWLPGAPLADARPRSDALLGRVGALLGSLDGALADFEDPRADRDHPWEIRRAPERIRRGAEAVRDPERRALLDRVLELHRSRVAPLLDDLPVQVIHGDANDRNVLVGPVHRTPDGEWRREVTGLIDFGDAVRSLRVAEAAVAGAYALLDRPDPVRAMIALVGAYHGKTPLTPPEIEALFPLLLLRLALSVTMSAGRREAVGDNPYLAVSERPAWEALERLVTASPDLLHYRLRGACGLEPCPRSPVVGEWLAARGATTPPVLDPGDADDARVVFDLSVGSPELGSEHDRLSADEFTELLFRRMETAGAPVGVGRYDEPRRWYAGDAYAVPGEEPERRTVHLGADLFAAAGTPVRAPLAGTVHSVADNDAPLDYGPTVIIRHEAAPDAGGQEVVFYTLYGHLSRATLEGIAPGDRIESGESFGALGGSGENGGWPPHLHFQVVVDLLGMEGDFPGVAAPSERSTWLSLSPDPSPLLGIPSQELRYAPPMERDELEETRRRLLGPNLSLSHAKPLEIVRGSGVRLFDREGRAYLDARNNVPHVGHAHPRVVEAGRRQAAVLNTNTRYLHDAIVRYADRLSALLPEELCVFWFVNSGSEANELALRIARTVTGGREVVAVEGGYHGNTSALIDISPYKFDGPGGVGAPDWVRVADVPDPYRGRHRGRGAETGSAYAVTVGEAADAAAAGGGLAAFFVEPLPGCAGQIVPPEGYLSGAFRRVRAAGGLCVADEVQVGFGRVGSHWWAFETQGAVPDILTLGKPMGNGHPLGAVVTTPEIAAAFDTGMEYFNTFGGNPVSCEVGLAVLDVMEEEGLRENAREVGDRLLSGLRELRARHPAVGDVRGLGLYLGVELVTDPERRTPFGDGAAYLVERMRERGVLLGTDGLDGNVVKIKPPLPFSATDADDLVETMDAVLREDFLTVG